AQVEEELGGVVDGTAGEESDREAAVVGPAADRHGATVAVARPALRDPAERAGRYLVQAGDRAGVVVEERHRLVELAGRGELDTGTPEEQHLAVRTARVLVDGADGTVQRD